jgi:hypothetical protein
MSERAYREDALKHIHKAGGKERRPTLESIPGEAGIGLNDAARLIGRMGADGLLRDEAGTPHLAPAGRDAALHVIRAHRVWVGQGQTWVFASDTHVAPAIAQLSYS